MSSVWNKIDSGLASIYSDYLLVRKGEIKDFTHVHPAAAATDGRLNVTLQHTGDLADIEPLGFQTVSVAVRGVATGTVSLSNLERLAAHPAVQKMSFGQARKPTLDKSLPDVRTAGIWKRENGEFTGFTGTGVIIGVIDTGIDVHHPFFRETTPPKTTRILRIWDQGLEPEPGDTQPNPAFLSETPATLYGVEYNRAQIMAALGGLGNFRHRDCSGHGTHVASIAAGNGQDDFKYMGVAPEAELIIVKNLFLHKYPQINGGDAPYGLLFRDAVAYILNVVKNDFNDRPVVINASLGDAVAPHDGFTLDEDFLTKQFVGAKGKCFVAAAGNDASTDEGAVKRAQHARIEFPAGTSTVELSFFMYDARTNKLETDFCVEKNQTEKIPIKVYYPDGPTELSFTMKLPVGGTVAGPDFGDPPKSSEFAFGRRCNMKHSSEPATRSFTQRTPVQRRLFEIEIVPHKFKHVVDVLYTLTIESPGELTAHVWCDNGIYGVFIVDPELPNVFIEDRFQIESPGGAEGIMTVTAYHAERGTESNRPITSFSSRGPLVSYDPAQSQPDKPDIAAPGEDVDAARSRDYQPRRKKKNPDTRLESGTSMATPHVAGAVALMLEKDPTLTTADIMDKLKVNARKIPATLPDDILARKLEYGAGMLDVQEAVRQVN